MPSGTFTFAIGGGTEDAALTGDLDIADSLTILGAGPGLSIIDANGMDRVFHVLAGGSATISDVTIRGGVVPANRWGAGVWVESAARRNLSRVVITGNSAGSGAGLYNNGTLFAIDTILSNNSAADYGGGLYNDGGTATLERVTINGNTAGGDGGGVCNSGAGAVMSLVNATVSGNTAAGSGGGIWTNRAATATNATIAFNVSAAGAGVFGQGGGGSVTFNNSLLYNPSGGNANKAMASLGNNIDSDGTAGLTGPGDLASVNPLLDPTLRNNGGLTPTHALLAGSPAINAGTATGAPATDQRNIARLGATDIGAFECAANRLIVDTTSDVVDGNTSSVATLMANKGADGRISLREAIMATNNTANLASPDEIHFAILGAGPHTINVSSALPTITNAVIIDGWSEPDYAGTPVIELNGTSAGAGVDGLRVTAGGTTVRGLVINRFSGNGIELSGSSGNTIQGNYLGTDLSGSADRGNGLDGINIDNSANNVIGGLTPAERNVISGNSIHGVRIIGESADNNIIQGNYIGLNAAGTAAIGNTYNGIIIYNGADNNLVGGTALGAGNVVSGNLDTGVEIQDGNSTGNRIEGNIIGLNAAGTAAIGNLDGVIIEDAPNNTVGGATAAHRNIISGNTGAGQGSGVVIFGSNATGNLVQNNYIGTDITGTLDRGNKEDGVLISDRGDGGVVKGAASGNTVRGNVLSGNDYSGVSICNSGVNNNLILGNYIGVDATGSGALGNSVFGVVIWNGADGNRVGGVNAGGGNVIAFNNRGVLVDANSTASMNNSIRGNSIHSNTGLGIDLE